MSDIRDVAGRPGFLAHTDRNPHRSGREPVVTDRSAALQP